MISIRVEQLEHATKALAGIKNGVKKAASRAINRAAESARTAAVRKAREEYVIQARVLRDSIRITKASAGNLGARVVSTGQRLPLIKFKVRPTSPQKHAMVYAAVKKGGMKPIPHAFIARMPSGHIGVYTRVGQSRLPLKERYGPAAPQMIGSPTVAQFVEEQAAKVMEQRLDHEISRLLEGAT